LKIGIVIPARLESERLPNKVLLEFMGRSMIEHVWQRAQLVEPKIEIVIATDNELIKTKCDQFGAVTVLTKNSHLNGLSRVGEVSIDLNWDFYIVLQADEILIEPKNLKFLIDAIKSNLNFDFYNLITGMDNVSELNDTNTVKCIIRNNNSIINFTRKSSSVASKPTQLNFTKKVCGVYAISKRALGMVATSPATQIEMAESIEQMKIIEMGLDVLGVIVGTNYPSVNTKHDVLAVLEILESSKEQQAILRLIQ